MIAAALATADTAPKKAAKPVHIAACWLRRDAWWNAVVAPVTHSMTVRSMARGRPYIQGYSRSRTCQADTADDGRVRADRQAVDGRQAVGELRTVAAERIDLQTRLSAAAIVVPYLHPKLSATQVQANHTVTRIVSAQPAGSHHRAPRAAGRAGCDRCRGRAGRGARACVLVSIGHLSDGTQQRKRRARFRLVDGAQGRNR